MARAQAYQKKYFDKHHRDVEFTVGQEVLLSSSHIPLAAGRKLGQRWLGPFVICRRVGRVAYELSLPASWAIHPVFHVSLLRAYQAGGVSR